MQMGLRLALVAWFAVGVTATSLGQEPAAVQPAGPAKAAFDQRLSEIQAVSKQLQALEEEYANAEPKRRTEIQQEAMQLGQQGRATFVELVAAAEKAFAEAPNADDTVTGVLAQGASMHVGSDNYEEGLRLAQLLIANKFEDKRVYGLAGIAAFSSGDFDAAEAYLKVAKENEALDRTGEMNLSLIPYYKDAWAKEQKIRAAEAQAADLPRVLLKTNKGEIEIELFENEAPVAVANFVSLVEKGYYDGLTFHRVIPQFMAQGGCPQGTGTGGPGYNIPCECYEPDHRLHFRGSLSMAHAGRDTGGSQFFLTFVPTRHLDGKHTCFGRIVRGMEVLGDLQRRDPGNPAGPQPDKIVEAKVLRKRDHAYVPTKAGQ